MFIIDILFLVFGSKISFSCQQVKTTEKQHSSNGINLSYILMPLKANICLILNQKNQEFLTFLSIHY